MSPIRAAVAVAATELSRVARDRTGLLFIVVLPVLVIIVIGTTIGAAGGRVEIGVLDADASEASARLVAEIEAAPGAEVTRYDRLEQLEVDVRLDRVTAGVVVPAGFGAQVRQGATAGVEMLVDPSRARTAAARSVVSGVVDRVGAVEVATRVAVDLTGADPATARDVAVDVAAATPPTEVAVVEVAGGGIDSGSPYSYPAAANLVLFTFINSLTVGAALVESRRLGVTRRLLAGPVGPGTVVAGFGLSRVVVAVAQGAIVLALGVLLFSVAWGDPAAVVLLVLLFALVSAGAGLLVGGLARNTDQAVAVGIPLAIAAGMLGGAMWPLQFVPDALRIAGHVTPHAWAMDAWIEVLYEGAGVADIARELAVLALIAAALLAVASRVLRRAVVAA